MFKTHRGYDLVPTAEGPAYVSELVRSGSYVLRADVLREGIRLVEELEKRLALLDAALARGLADADAGRIKSPEDVQGLLTAKYTADAASRGE